MVRRYIKFPIKQLKGKYCLSPFMQITVDRQGDVRLCGCSWWMTQPVGNILTTSLDDILSSQIAIDVRRSIIDGSYVYCNEKVCGVMANNGLNTVNTLPPSVAALVDDPVKYDLPYHINLDLDLTCNLSCPSCRHTVIKVPDEEKEQQREIGRILSKNLFSKPTDKKIVVEISAGGEIFASEMLMEMLTTIDTSVMPNLEIHLGTNGTLITKRWKRLQSIEHLIKKITVSVDAATPDVYERVRRGGKWTDVYAGMEFLKSKKQQFPFSLNARLIFQKENYKDSELFHHLCMQWDVDVVEYSRVYSWNTWTPEEFAIQDVYHPGNAEYSQAQEVVARLKQLPKTWFNGF